MRRLRLGTLIILISLARQPAVAQFLPAAGGTAPNAWMKAPTKRSEPDRVPPPVRAQRDEYFDRIIGRQEALTPENASQRFMGEGSFLGEQPEILEFPNRAVLIGTFNNYKSVLSASGRAIYTEATIRVQEKFEDISGASQPGADITIVLPGGTVSEPGSGAISFLTQPRSFFVQPGKTYLFVLGYHAVGDFYMVGKDWDLSDGTVRPNSGLDLKRQKEGTSSLIGLTRAQLVQSLNKRFSANQ